MRVRKALFAIFLLTAVNVLVHTYGTSDSRSQPLDFRPVYGPSDTYNAGKPTGGGLTTDSETDLLTSY